MLAPGLDDLHVRFIINLPHEDLLDMNRLSFMMEEAHWYYEDFIRALNPSLPTYNLKGWIDKVFEHCPIFEDVNRAYSKQAYHEFLAYKKRIPVRGAILLNRELDKLVLVKGYKKNSSWSFPRGKMNRDESPLDCAIRELYEETGFDVREAGLLPKDESTVKHLFQEIKDQEIRLFVFRNVPEDTVFQPQTRGEISEVRWWKISDLPAYRHRSQRGVNLPQVESDAARKAARFFMVAPFLDKLKKWVVQQKKLDAARAKAEARRSPHIQPDLTEDEVYVADAYQTDRPTVQDQVPCQDMDLDANSELKRLLNIQPAPQEVPGLQQNPASTPADGSAALLALLKGAPASDGIGSETGRAYPQTPLEHICTDAPQPRSPNQNHTNQPPQNFNSYLPAPRFPYPPAHDRTIQGQYYEPSPVPSITGPGLQAQVDADPTTHPTAPLTSRNTTNDLVPLAHPQPKPPQFQTDLLTHGMIATPEDRGAPAPPGDGALSQQHYPQHQWKRPPPYQSAISKPWVQHHQKHHQQKHQQQAQPLSVNETVPSESHVAGRKAVPDRLLTGNGFSLLNEANDESKVGQGNLSTVSHRFSYLPRYHDAPVLQPSRPGHQPQPMSSFQGQVSQKIEEQVSLAIQNRTMAKIPNDKHKSALLSMFKTSDVSPASRSGQNPTGSSSNLAAHVAGSRSQHLPASAGRSHGIVENQSNGVSLAARDASSSDIKSGALGVSKSGFESGPQAQNEAALPHRMISGLNRPGWASGSPKKSPTRGSITSFHAAKPPRTIGSPLSNKPINTSEETMPLAMASCAKSMQKRSESLSKEPLGEARGKGYNFKLPIGSPHGLFGGHGSAHAAGSFLGSDSSQLPRGKETSVEHKKNLLALFGSGGSADDAASISSGFNKDKLASGTGSAGGQTPRSQILPLPPGNAEIGGMSGLPNPSQQPYQSHKIAHHQQAPPSVESVMSRQGSHQTSHSRRSSARVNSPLDRDFLLGYLADKIKEDGEKQ